MIYTRRLKFIFSLIGFFIFSVFALVLYSCLSRPFFSAATYFRVGHPNFIGDWTTIEASGLDKFSLHIRSKIGGTPDGTFGVLSAVTYHSGPQGERLPFLADLNPLLFHTYNAEARPLYLSYFESSFYNLEVPGDRAFIMHNERRPLPNERRPLPKGSLNDIVFDYDFNNRSLSPVLGFQLYMYLKNKPSPQVKIEDWRLDL